MATRTKVTIEGTDELLAALDDFGKRLRKNAARRGFKKAGEQVATVMKANARSSQDTGTLISGITSQVRRSKARPGTYYLLVGPTNKLTMIGKRRMNPRFYTHLVEGGTKPHSLQPKVELGRSALAKLVAGAVNRYRPVPQGKMHPGARAKPFVQPTFEQTEQLVVDTLFAELNKTLDRAVRKKNKAKKVKEV